MTSMDYARQIDMFETYYKVSLCNLWDVVTPYSVWVGCYEDHHVPRRIAQDQYAEHGINWDRRFALRLDKHTDELCGLGDVECLWIDPDKWRFKLVHDPFRRWFDLNYIDIYRVVKP